MAEQDPIHPDFLNWWNFADPAASQAVFEAELAKLPDAGARSRSAQLLAQIARARGLQGEFSAGHVMLDQAESLLAGNDLPVARLRCLLERGRLFDSLAHSATNRRTEEARACYLEVYDTATKLGFDELAVDAAHMLAIIESDNLSWNLTAIAIAEASSSPFARSWLGSLYNNTGWSHHGQGDFYTALDMFERAFAFQSEHGTPDQKRVARWCVARCLRSLEQLQRALSIQQELLTEYDTEGLEEPGYAAEELAECLLALGRVQEARPWFAEAHRRLTLHEGWLSEHEPGRMARLAHLGSQ